MVAQLQFARYEGTGQLHRPGVLLGRGSPVCEGELNGRRAGAQDCGIWASVTDHRADRCLGMMMKKKKRHGGCHEDPGWIMDGRITRRLCSMDPCAARCTDVSTRVSNSLLVGAIIGQIIVGLICDRIGQLQLLIVLSASDSEV